MEEAAPAAAGAGQGAPADAAAKQQQQQQPPPPLQQQGGLADSTSSVEAGGECPPYERRGPCERCVVCWLEFVFCWMRNPARA